MATTRDDDFIIIHEDRTLKSARDLQKRIGGTLTLLPALPNTQEGKMYVDEITGELIQNRLVTIIILIDRIAFEHSRDFFQQFIATASRIQRPIILCPVTRSIEPFDTWIQGGYYWINVNEVEKINRTLTELRSKVPGSFIEPKLLEHINRALCNSYIIGLSEEEVFHFELLREKWIEFESLDLTNTKDIYERLRNEFPKIDLNVPEIYEDLKFEFSDFLQDFSSSKLTFQGYFNVLKPGIKYYIFKLIGQLVAYFDMHGYNKSIWNRYKDERTVARSHVTQTNWVKNLLRYKISGINETSDSIYNAISFIKAPAISLTMLSENHRKRVADNILKTTYNNETFAASLFAFFSRHLNVRNEENRGVAISEILYSEKIKEIWGYIEDVEEEEPVITSEAPKGEDPLLLSDEWAISESDESTPGTERLALIMSNLITKLKETDKGKMVGVFGDWGRGKTFLMDKIWKNLKKTNSYHDVKFHAWKYQDTPASWAYLYEAFAKEYFKADPDKWALTNEIRSFGKLLELNYVRIGLKPVFRILALITLSIVGYKLTKDYNQVFRLLVFFGGVSAATLQLFTSIKKAFSKEAKELFKKYYTRTSFSNLLGIQAEIQKELKCLLKTWVKEKDGTINKKIVLFVDDIDRCSEERIISIIDSLRVMLEDDEISKRVIVVAAIDERVLKRAIKCKYHDLLTKDLEGNKNGRSLESRTIVNEYMDKLFITGIHLGSLNNGERKEILGKYIGKGKVRPVKMETKLSDVQNNPSTKGADSSVPPPANDIKTKNAQPNGFAVTPVQPKPAKVDPSPKIDESRYDLYGDEDKTLSALLDYHDSLTPRQIRIFYYRYLLARNILKDRLTQAGSRPTQFMLDNLARFTMHYTKAGDQNLIGQNKLKLLNKQDPQATFEIFNSNEVFPTHELLLIHEVLEMVIAY